ncbi:MAG: AEC family transporter [Rhizobiaceae bacterium]
MALLVEIILIFPLALIIMDIGASVNSQNSFAGLLREIIAQLVKNPILLAIIAGLLASTTDFQLPEVAGEIVNMMAQASAATSLFFVGGLLVGTTIKGSIRSIAAVSISKLIVHPIMVGICILLLPDFNPQLQVTAVLLATSPMLAIFPIIGAQYGYGQISASITLVTTVASFVSISVILLFISNNNFGL